VSVDGDDAFVRRIADHRILSAAEEADLARRTRRGDLAAREELVRHNMRLVLSVVHRYGRSSSVPLPDLIQDGIVGLHVAVDKFEPERGNRLSTYASWWIRKAVVQGIAEMGSGTIRLPSLVRERRARALTILSRAPDKTLEQVAEELGDDPRLVREALAAAFVASSLDEDYRTDDLLVDSHADDPEDVPDDLSHVRRAVACLGRLERSVIEMRFGMRGEPMSVPSIAKRLRRPEHVVQAAQRRALEELRRSVDLSRYDT
jgi:RNA polymerase primary sigma factor